MARRRPRRQHVFDMILNNPNPVIRYGFAAIIIFGSLYLISGYTNAQWPTLVAVIVALGIFVVRKRNGLNLDIQI